MVATLEANQQNGQLNEIDNQATSQAVLDEAPKKRRVVNHATVRVTRDALFADEADRRPITSRLNSIYNGAGYEDKGKSNEQIIAQVNDFFSRLLPIYVDFRTQTVAQHELRDISATMKKLVEAGAMTEEEAQAKIDAYKASKLVPKTQTVPQTEASQLELPIDLPADVLGKAIAP